MELKDYIALTYAENNDLISLEGLLIKPRTKSGEIAAKEISDFIIANNIKPSFTLIDKLKTYLEVTPTPFSSKDMAAYSIVWNNLEPFEQLEFQTFMEMKEPSFLQIVKKNKFNITEVFNEHVLNEILTKSPKWISAGDSNSVSIHNMVKVLTHKVNTYNQQSKEPFKLKQYQSVASTAFTSVTQNFGGLIARTKNIQDTHELAPLFQLIYPNDYLSSMMHYLQKESGKTLGFFHWVANLPEHIYSSITKEYFKNTPIEKQQQNAYDLIYSSKAPKDNHSFPRNDFMNNYGSLYIYMYLADSNLAYVEYNTNPTIFKRFYELLAEPCLDYIEKYNKPPYTHKYKKVPESQHIERYNEILPESFKKLVSNTYNFIQCYETFNQSLTLSMTYKKNNLLFPLYAENKEILLKNLEAEILYEQSESLILVKQKKNINKLM